MLAAINLASAEADEPLLSLGEAATGQLLFNAPGGHFHQAVHLKTEVYVSINGMVAKTTYRQKFKNTSNNWREAIYVFPLAENAAVNGMEMILGDRIIRSVIKEKAEAKKIYREAKQAGKKAALTSKQRPNLFTQKVANIAPGEQIEVRITYLQQVSYDSGQFRLQLPTTLTPRYVPGRHIREIELSEVAEEKHLVSSPFGWARATDQVKDAPLISPFMLPERPGQPRNPISIHIRLNPGLKLSRVDSSSHKIQQQQNQQGEYEIELASSIEPMNRDFWLTWAPVPKQQPEAAVFQETVDGENYAMLMLLPPTIKQSEAMDLPRSITLVLDTSGSMGGASIEQAKSSLLLALERLDAKDLFNIIEFNSGYRQLFPAPINANGRNLQIAKNFVRQLHADGGTNMAPALQAALSAVSNPEYLKQVVFITDGAVGNEEALFKLIKQQLGDARLFTLGIGSAPNSYFMNRAAQFGCGSFEYISSPDQVNERMSNLFRKLESPMMTNLNIQLPRSLQGKIEQYPKRLPDLYAGEPLVLNLKAENGASLSGKVEISGDIAGTEHGWKRSLSLQKTTDQNQASGVSTLWARAKIADLMDEKIQGRSEEEVKAEVLKVALPHMLVTQYSSLVAVEEKISRDAESPLKPGIIPNRVAKGQNMQPQAYPETATWLPLHLLLSALSIILLLAMYPRQILQQLARSKDA